MTSKMITENTAADCLAALGNLTRLQVFRVLVRAGDTGLNVGDLQRYLKIPGSTLAHHLGHLTRVGLVQQDRRGREVICRANYQTMRNLTGFLTEECCVGVPLTEKDKATSPHPR